MGKVLTNFLKMHLDKILEKPFYPTKDFNKAYYENIPYVFYKF